MATGSSAWAFSVGSWRIFDWKAIATPVDAFASAWPAASLLSMSTGLVSTVSTTLSTSGCRIVSVDWLQFGLRTNVICLFCVYDWIMNGPDATGCLV